MRLLRRHQPGRTLRSLGAPAAALALLAGVSACGQDEPAAAAQSQPAANASGDAAGAQKFPDITAVEVTRTGETYSFNVSVSSPYDTEARYADAFRVSTPNGKVLGVREVDHDHASEQPFTRSLDGVTVPAGVSTVQVEGRDQANGWGGGTRMASIPSR